MPLKMADKTRFYTGVMHAEPKSLDKIAEHFEDFPAARSVLYIPYILLEDKVQDDTHIDAFFMNQDGKRECKEDIKLDTALTTYEFRPDKNKVVLIGVGYQRIREYLEKRYKEAEHLSRKYEIKNFREHAPLRISNEEWQKQRGFEERHQAYTQFR